MIGVQSCKHFGCQRSHPMILGFRHPSGALEDGARGKSFGLSTNKVVHCISFSQQSKSFLLHCTVDFPTSVQTASMYTQDPLDPIVRR